MSEYLVQEMDNEPGDADRDEIFGLAIDNEDIPIMVYLTKDLNYEPDVEIWNNVNTTPSGGNIKLFKYFKSLGYQPEDDKLHDLAYQAIQRNNMDDLIDLRQEL